MARSLRTRGPRWIPTIILWERLVTRDGRRPDLDGAGYNGGKPGRHLDLDCDRQQRATWSPAILVSRSRSLVPTRRSASRQRTEDQTVVLGGAEIKLEAMSEDDVDYVTRGPPIPRWGRSLLARR